MSLYDTMPTMEGVTAGETALCKMPIGRKFHWLDLVYSGVTLAEMKEIRIILNGEVVQRFSATQRDKMNQFYGLEAAAGVLCIPFDRFKMKNRDQEQPTAINTGGRSERGDAISAFMVEVDIDAAALAPNLKLWAEMSNRSEGGAGVVQRIRKESRAIGGAGELEVSDFKYGSKIYQSINAIFMEPSAGTISKAEIWRNTYRSFNRTVALNEKAQKQGVRAPVAGMFVIDTTERGYGANQVPLFDEKGVKLSDFRVVAHCSAAATVNYIIEYMGELGQQ